jgi:hypothetical protein
MKMVFAANALTAALFAGSVFAAAHSTPGVTASDQDVSSGVVSADEVTAGENGWMVVHRVKEDGKPGPVVGHAPLRAGVNADVAAILTEPVASGEKLMLMVHAEVGGTQTGIFEYSLGAKEDGPIRIDEKLVMAVITAK